MKTKASAAISTVIFLLLIIGAALIYLWISIPQASAQNSNQVSLPSETQNSIDEGLVAHYEFEKLVSGQTPDSSGNHNTGFVGNQVFMTDDSAVGENAFRFSGVFREQGGSVTIPNSASLQLQDQMTISLWIKATDWENIGDWTFEDNPDSPHLHEYFKIHNLIDRRDHWSSMDWELIYPLVPWEKQSGLYVWFANEDREHYEYGSKQFQAGQSTVFSKLGNNLAENEWYLITVTKNGEWWNLYLNGKLVSTEKRPNSNIGSNDDIHIGEPFTGIIDDLRIYNIALSPEQVAQLYSMKNPDWVPVFS